MKDDNSTPPSAAKKAVGKQAPKRTEANKVAKKTEAKKAASEKAEKKYSHGMNRYPPEILADLAIKLAQLKTDRPENRDSGSRRPSYRASDVDFKGALKAAEILLLAASGETGEDVHAYQLFTEKDGLMSFDGIAQRFQEAGWPRINVGNTVKPIIEELVIAADSEVQKERERYETLVSVRLRYPGGLHYVVDRVKRHIRNMIGRTDLRVLFDDPRLVADVMGQLFFRLMEKKTPADWVSHLDEDYANVAGFESFIEYVCGGLTYEKFIGEPTHVWMDLERLGCFIFFLEGLGEEAFARKQFTGPNLRSLMSLVRSRDDVSRETISDLNVCLAELQKTGPDAVRVGELAGRACLQLRAMWERWYLIRLARAQGFSKLRRVARSGRRGLNRGRKVSAAKVEQILKLLQSLENSDKAGGESIDADQLRKLLDEARKSLDVPDLSAATKLPIIKVRLILKLLRQADNVGKPNGETVDAPQLRQLLEDVLSSLKDPELIAAANVPARFYAGTITDEMRRVADGLEKGLRMKLPTKQHLKEALNNLLNELRPYSGDRKCRPYELFLFAAQNRIQEKKLVCRLPGFIPNPPYPLSLSIMLSHKGADIAMGIEDPG